MNRKIGEYEILRLLARGASGSVFEAVEPQTARGVALKLLDGQQHAPQWAEALEEFSRVAHPNLVQVLDVFPDERPPYCIMPLVQGPDLLSYVREHAEPPTHRPTQGSSTLLLLGSEVNERNESEFRSCDDIGFTRAREAMLHVSQGLAKMHELGWVHCDVRPDNVRVEEGRAVVLDLGLARRTGRADAQASPVGTAAYMAPEQWRAQNITPATDWYALGVTLFEVLTGALPFAGTAGEIFVRKRSVGAPSPGLFVAGVPEDLDQLCVDLMRTSPEHRPGANEIDARLRR